MTMRTGSMHRMRGTTSKLRLASWCHARVDAVGRAHATARLVAQSVLLAAALARDLVPKMEVLLTSRRADRALRVRPGAALDIHCGRRPRQTQSQWGFHRATAPSRFLAAPTELFVRALRSVVRGCFLRNRRGRSRLRRSRSRPAQGPAHFRTIQDSRHHEALRIPGSSVRAPANRSQAYSAIATRRNRSRTSCCGLHHAASVRRRYLSARRTRQQCSRGASRQSVRPTYHRQGSSGRPRDPAARRSSSPKPALTPCVVFAHEPARVPGARPRFDVPIDPIEMHRIMRCPYSGRGCARRDGVRGARTARSA
jgi:hypothetical protein